MLQSIVQCRGKEVPLAAPYACIVPVVPVSDIDKMLAAATDGTIVILVTNRIRSEA